MARQTLVFLIGPPAVGKMAVGEELRSLTGFPLFHNHVSIEAVLPVFDFGTRPFNRLVGDLRRQVFKEVAASDLPGLIFTYVWAFDLPSELRSVKRLKSIFEKGGGRTVFVELWADLDTRLERNQHASRLAAKPSKRDVARSRANLLEIEESHRVTSDGDFPFPEYLRIDNTHVPADEAARRIADRFGLETV